MQNVRHEGFILKFPHFCYKMSFWKATTLPESAPQEPSRFWPSQNDKQGSFRGFIALASVLVISVVVLSITISVMYLSIGQGQSSLALSKGEDQLAFVEGCMEDALLKIRANASYSSGSITRPEGTCTITVSPAGSVYTVTTTGATTMYKRTIQAVASRSASLTITSWKEL